MTLIKSIKFVKTYLPTTHDLRIHPAGLEETITTSCLKEADNGQNVMQKKFWLISKVCLSEQLSK